MILNFRYRLRPRRSQRKLLDKHLSSLCWLYNKAIEAVKGSYEKKEPYPKRSGLYKRIHQWVQEKPELKDIHSQVIQNVCDRVDKAFKAFFRRVKNGETPGYPRFKSWKRYRSFTFPQSGFSLDDNMLKLSKIGTIKVVLHRPLRGKIKTCTIKKDAVGDFWVSFAVEVPQKPLPENNKVIGIDVGLINLVAFSDGTKIKAPKYYRKWETKLAKAQRKLSGLDRASQKYQKQRKIVAKIHRRIWNLRHNFTHQLSSYIVKNYGYIFYEDLDLKNLISKNYAKSWHDAAVGLLISQIAYKAESADRYHAGVNAAYTSQNCSSCEKRVPKDLWTRIHRCPYCNYVEDRDVNASKNVERLGIQSLEADERCSKRQRSTVLLRSPHL